MKVKCIETIALVLLVFSTPGSLMANVLTDFDSTQPRGFMENSCGYGLEVLNDQGQDLCAVKEGFRAPQRLGDGNHYRDWAGMTMGNAARDPAFFATTYVANNDFINLIYAAVAKGIDTFNQDLFDLVGIGTAREVACALELYDPNIGEPCIPGGDIQLLEEDKIPLTADMCLRCHTPVGWMEGNSEPATPHAPFLKGQFWGAAFKENPVDEFGNPRAVNTLEESEAEMEGMQCDFCHRAKFNEGYTRQSRYDGRVMAAGNGSFFSDMNDTTRVRHHLRDGADIPEGTEAISGESGGIYECFSCHTRDFSFGYLEIIAHRDCAHCHGENSTGTGSSGGFADASQFCGACHDVTNPLIYTRTSGVDRMLHPIERTYTEWYWSGYRGNTKCQDCHVPMKFQGAQTWLLYPGLDMLWGPIDDKWTKPPYNYSVNPWRTQSYMDAMNRNRAFMRDTAADIALVNTPAQAAPGQVVTVNVKVTNKTGHKLPSGFAEGRQMWLHVQAVDQSGTLLFESGYLLPDGSLARKEYFAAANGGFVMDPGKTMIKVYEQLVLAEGYKNFKLDGYSIIDADKDGTVTHAEEEFHFVLMNYIEKDNRIPPLGYNKEAYMKDGAFIVPHDPKDTDYPTGQNWDVTPYAFTIPASAQGAVTVTATLKYQTFNREYMEFLNEHDTENTEKFGGRARNLPDGPFENHMTWGNVTFDIWTAANMGEPVVMGTATEIIALQ